MLRADSAAIYLAEERDQLELAAASGGTPGESFAGRVAERREAMLDDAEDSSMIGVPLLAGGELTGVLVVCAAAPRHFSPDDLNLLRLAADRVALAIDHARLYQRELKIAETLQRSLLPERLPGLPGLEVAARYLPAAAEAEVGGDWYDVLTISGGRVGLVMGDIAGKGLAAASMVGRLRSALRAYALEGHSPELAVGRLNRLIWAEAQEGQMATLLFMVVDPAEGRVEWVNAGHPPPLLAMGSEPPRFLEGASSVPLGVLPFPSFRASSVEVDADSTVVLYTDGLIERPGENIDLGLERLAKLVNGQRGDPNALCDLLLKLAHPRRRAGRRRGTPGPAHRSHVRPFQRRVRARARGARVHARAPAALAAPRGGQRQRARRDRDRLRRGGHQRDRALGCRRGHSLRAQRPPGGQKGRADPARSGRLAPSSRR